MSRHRLIEWGRQHAQGHPELADDLPPDAAQRLTGQCTVGAGTGQAYADHIAGDRHQLNIAAVLLDAGSNGLDDVIDQC